MGRIKFFLKSEHFILLLFAVLISGCASGHCRGRKPSSEPHIKIFKADGSQQCAQKSGLSLDVMAEQLKDIQIFSKENRADGKMHMMMCGAATGKINVYEILKKDGPAALAAGFQEWVE